MKILNYTKFFEAFLSGDKESAIDKIINHITRGSNIDLHRYDEVYHIQKGEEFFEGILYISVISNKGVRLNWSKSNVRNIIHSIDVWQDFEFGKDPDFTLEIGESSVVKVLPQILDFFQNPEKFIKSQGVLQLTEELDSGDRLKELEGKLKRARTEERKQKIKEDIEKCKASKAIDEKRELESDKIDADLDFDVFKAIELYTTQVARKKSNSLIISGMSGIGKTQVVKETLKELGLTPETDYYFATGTVTAAGLYELLFKNRTSLTVFDDCDAVFKDPDSVNMLKGALDTYDVREITKLTKGNTFETRGMSDGEIEEKWIESGKMPNKFEFRGQIIFISNLGEDKFDKAILSRSLHVDVHLNREEVIGRMRDIMKKINPNVDITEKEEALEYLIYITENFPVKFDLNIRTLIHSINLRSGNDDEIEFGGKTEKVWKLLIKKYLVSTKNY
jgi:hypothetical protein